MWNGTNIDIELQRNAVKRLGFAIYDEISGEPVSLVGYSLGCAVRYAAGSGAILSSPVAIFANAATGKFNVAFDGRDLVAVVGPLETVVLAYEVLAYSPSNEPILVMRGALKLNPGVVY